MIDTTILGLPMRLSIFLFIAASVFSGCKARSDSQLQSSSGKNRDKAPASKASTSFGASANWENEKLTFVRNKNAGDFLNLNVVRFGKQSNDSFEIYGKKSTYPSIKTKCVTPGKEYTCDRDLKNPDFGDRINFGAPLKFVKKTAAHSVYEGVWPCGKVIEFVSEKPSKNKKQCLITAKVKTAKKKVVFSVKVRDGMSLAGSGVDLEVLPMPFVDQPLQKEIVLAAMKRVRERWPDDQIEQLGASPPNIDMGTREKIAAQTIINCNENFVPWWSDIVVHYYCQLPAIGVRDCFTGSVRGGYDYMYRPYFTPIPGYEGSSLGGAFDYCLHDGEKKKKTPFYDRTIDLSQLPDQGNRGNFKWLAVTPVLDDSGQPFTNSDGKPITHGEVFEYIMSSGVAIGSHPDLSDQFDKMSGDLGSKLFTLDAVWREYAKISKELIVKKDAVNAGATWVDPDATACADNLLKLKGWGSCRNPANKAACKSIKGCSWDECDGNGLCFESNETLCSFISTKVVCETSPECVINSAGNCSSMAASDSTELKALKQELDDMLAVTKSINSAIEDLKRSLKPIREKMHFNDNFSTVSTFNNEDQQWVINQFYNLSSGAEQKVCEPNLNGTTLVAGYLNPPDGTCCADTRFARVGVEGRTAKIRFQRNQDDERGARDNNCEKDAQGVCLLGGISGGNIKLANVCLPAPLPAGVVINNPEL